MIQKTINKLLLHRHFWRLTIFDELTELYINMLVQSMATCSLAIALQPKGINNRGSYEN